MDVRDKVAVVTGAASGIGAALCVRLLLEGAYVVAGDLDGDRLAGRHAAQSEDALATLQGDTATENGIAALVGLAEERFGPVDIYFANAGVGVGAGLAATEADWALAHDVNVMGHVRAARLLVPRWVERGGGYFFSTASAAGLLTQVGSPVYSVTKSAALSFAEWLAVTYGDQGVRVSCLVPMGVDTPLLSGGADGSVSRAAAAAVIGAGKVLSAENVADAVLATVRDESFLCTPHPEVRLMVARKVNDLDRWIKGMQRYRRSLSASS